MLKILLVEDDLQIQEIIGDYFNGKSDGEIEEVCVANGADGLPEVDSFTICRELRRNSDVPIIFLTAREAEVDRLRSYGLGCDDYVVKPFSLAELHAKAHRSFNL